MLLVVLKMVMVMVAVVEVILFILLFILLKFRNFGATLVLIEEDFLGVALVETIDKRSLFGLGYSTNRYGLKRAFQITTNR